MPIPVQPGHCSDPVLPQEIPVSSRLSADRLLEHAPHSAFPSLTSLPGGVFAVGRDPPIPVDTPSRDTQLPQHTHRLKNHPKMTYEGKPGQPRDGFWTLGEEGLTQWWLRGDSTTPNPPCRAQRAPPRHRAKQTGLGIGVGAERCQISPLFF